MMKRVVACVILLCVGCTPPALQGPEVDLALTAAPDPVPVVMAPHPQPPAGPQPTAGFFRAWIPPQVSPNGDLVEGHWITVSTTAPAAEVVEPALTIPRPPKAKLEKVKPPKVQVPISQLPTIPQWQEERPSAMPGAVPGSMPGVPWMHPSGQEHP